MRAPVGDHSQRPVLTPASHKVRPGDTLYSIAWQYGYSVDEVAAWNALRAPYTIYKGQRIRLSAPPRPARKPVKRSVSPSRPKTSAPAKPVSVPKVATRTTVQPSSPKTAVQPSSPKTAVKPSSTASGRLVWSWPTRGKLIRRFNPKDPGKKGINIAGNSGQTVKAAAAGKVVYAGSGLGGYGRLIIIKHNKDFLSAYAHNRKLIAKEGQWVKRGESIATMGNSGTDRTQLHFEIRKSGRPVDPLRFLPK